jgi:hypothetical protein
MAAEGLRPFAANRDLTIIGFGEVRIAALNARYLFINISAPAAMARTASRMSWPLKARFNNGIKPVKISQMPSTNMPGFAASFIEELLLA